MKHLRFLAALCCMLAVFTACEKNEPNDNTNGNGINTDQNGGNSNTDNSSGSTSAPTGTENGHGYVDLGLPSGLKWATCNVGATNPEEYGNYFAWGETEPKTIYSYGTYYDYHVINNESGQYFVLDCIDDAANVNWGGAWRMPTNDEWSELIDNCTWTWTDDYNGTGVAGLIVTSNINGNSIFLPAAGYRYNDGLHAGYIGLYWSSTGYDGFSTEIYYLALCSDYMNINLDHSEYFYGYSVRPVLYDSDYNATGTENGYGYVDIGLPSGLKWATCNVGATKPEEYGNYYAWGETEPKTTYSWSTYKYGSDSDELTKYCTDSSYGTVDNKTQLELADDAARANWGGAWRMPTYDEWSELIDNCTWTWTVLNGHMGYIVKGTNGKSIFLPAVDFYYRDGLTDAGNGVHYWSSSLDTDYPYYAWYANGGPDIVNWYSRYYGRSVRPVLGE